MHFFYQEFVTYQPCQTVFKILLAPSLKNFQLTVRKTC